ncbi:two-component sensor histidine kinase [Deltaproteobacteria bacterium]|nr:two-component sensor histidine kinase [Deltaproteobacteria bacterium]
MLPGWQSPRTALQWLRSFRRAALVLVGLAMGLERAADPTMSLLPGAVVLTVVLLIEIGETAWIRIRGVYTWAVEAHVVVDLMFMLGAAFALKAADHPALDMLIQFVIPWSLGLSTRRAWAAAVALILIHNGLVVFGPALVDVIDPLTARMHVRQLTRVIIFDASALTITGFVVYLRSLLDDRESRLQQALDERARDERLVALGMMAAGIAHELGTPLSSIDMLAGEALEEPEEATPVLRTLRGQVQRCREILDRVRGTTSMTVSLEVESLGVALRRWVGDWQAAGLDRGELLLDVPQELDAVGIRGDPDTWRGICWSLLDNARRAGGPIEIRASQLPDGWAQVEVDDCGPGPSLETIARAGQPFYSAWEDGGREGRGLGLFVARSFARRWGGELKFVRGPAGGGRVTLRLATIPYVGRP